MKKLFQKFELYWNKFLNLLKKMSNNILNQQGHTNPLYAIIDGVQNNKKLQIQKTLNGSWYDVEQVVFNSAKPYLIVNGIDTKIYFNQIHASKFV